MPSDVLPHEKEVRARVVEVNEHLQKEAARVRQRLGIPEGGFASPGHAIKWRLRHCEENQASTGAYEHDLDAPRSPEGWHWLHQQELWAFDPAQTQVPLYAGALELIDRHILPDWAFFPVVWYLLTGQWWFPHREDELLPYPAPFGPRSHRLLKVDYPSDSECLLTIPIDEYTTRADVEALWPAVLMVRDDFRRRTGIRPPSSKQGVSQKWEERFSRWIEWYRLKMQLGSAEKVVEHLYDEDVASGQKEPHEIPLETVKYAIRQIEALVKPKT